MIQDAYRGLYAGYENKIYTLPAAFVKPYEKLATGVDDAQLERQMGSSVAFGNGQQVIIDHLQPALAERIATFTTDVIALGRYAEMGQPDIQMLREPQEVRDAYLRHIETGSWYGQLRAAWRLLRRDSQPGPLGCDSLLAEISNPLEVLGEGWQAIGQHLRGRFVRTPWEGTADWLRLGWLVRAGGRVWLPTAGEQARAYQLQAEPEAVGVNPAALTHGTVTLD